MMIGYSPFNIPPYKLERGCVIYALLDYIITGYGTVYLFSFKNTVLVNI